MGLISDFDKVEREETEYWRQRACQELVIDTRGKTVDTPLSTYEVLLAMCMAEKQGRRGR